MSQKFVGTTRVPVTLVKVGPCVVTQIKTNEKDGYSAVQLGFGTKSIKNVTKPLVGHLRPAQKAGQSRYNDGKTAPRHLCEVSVSSNSDLKIGDTVRLDQVFSPGDVVSVTGTTRGKGFAGVVKRWGFAGSPRTHGGFGQHRGSGSIGQGTTPGRVRKGKKMGGRMGGDTMTIKNLQVVEVDPENDQMLISGSLPGNTENFIIIEKIASGKISDLEEEVVQAVAQDESSVEGQEETKEEIAKETE